MGVRWRVILDIIPHPIGGIEGPIGAPREFSKIRYPGGEKSISQDEPRGYITSILFSMCLFRLV